MFNGTFTALITPMTGDGDLDRPGLEQLVEFQIAGNISGLVIAGTTGESPTLAWEEHCELIDRVCRLVAGRCAVIAGTGSNNTKETLAGTEHAAHTGADAVLLVDPYYNGPSSLAFIEQFGITYYNGPDLETRISEQYNIQGVPETFIIDKDGNIDEFIYAGISERSLSEKIERLLSQG